MDSIVGFATFGNNVCCRQEGEVLRSEDFSGCYEYPILTSGLDQISARNMRNSMDAMMEPVKLTSCKTV